MVWITNFHAVISIDFWRVERKANAVFVWRKLHRLPNVGITYANVVWKKCIKQRIKTEDNSRYPVLIAEIQSLRKHI